MCGQGSRFKKIGYTIPKYLIAINGAPMIYHAVETLGIPGKIHFIVKKSHLREYRYLEKLLLGLGDEIILCNYDTAGAAESLLLAERYVTELNKPFLSVNCDQYLDWDSNKFLDEIKKNTDVSYIPTYKETSNKCSYVKLNNEGYISEVREKQVISNDATIGLYHWAKTSDFFTDAKVLIEKNLRENNEYYVAPIYNISISRGLKIKNFPINNNEFWPIGTPTDLEIFLKEKRFNI